MLWGTCRGIRCGIGIHTDRRRSDPREGKSPCGFPRWNAATGLNNSRIRWRERRCAERSHTRAGHSFASTRLSLKGSGSPLGNGLGGTRGSVFRTAAYLRVFLYSSGTVRCEAVVFAASSSQRLTLRLLLRAQRFLAERRLALYIRAGRRSPRALGRLCLVLLFLLCLSSTAPAADAPVGVEEVPRLGWRRVAF